MEPIKLINFKFKKTDGQCEDIIPALIELLKSFEDGEFELAIIELPSNLSKAKARYFAMIDELGRHAGYQSRSDRELFKEQIRAELGGESIAAMKTITAVGIKIEELHQLAAFQYDYQFTPYEPGKV